MILHFLFVCCVGIITYIILNNALLLSKPQRGDCFHNGICFHPQYSDERIDVVDLAEHFINIDKLPILLRDSSLPAYYTPLLTTEQHSILSNVSIIGKEFQQIIESAGEKIKPLEHVVLEYVEFGNNTHIPELLFEFIFDTLSMIRDVLQPMNQYHESFFETTLEFKMIANITIDRYNDQTRRLEKYILHELDRMMPDEIIRQCIFIFEMDFYTKIFPAYDGKFDVQSRLKVLHERWRKVIHLYIQDIIIYPFW